jgi:hypothetical protein
MYTYVCYHFRVIILKREANLKEAFLAEQKQTSNTFRTLAHRKEVLAPPDCNDIANYRQALLVQRKKRPCTRLLSSAGVSGTAVASRGEKRQRLSINN